jgi:hypothetical protein
MVDIRHGDTVRCPFVKIMDHLLDLSLHSTVKFKRAGAPNPTEYTPVSHDSLFIRANIINRVLQQCTLR